MIKKLLSFIFISALPHFVSADEFADNYGIGILDINTSKHNTEIHLYKNKNDMLPFFDVRFDTVMKAECTDYKVTVPKDSLGYFAPEVFYKQEACVPFQLQFFCFQKKDGWYKVKLNNNKLKYAWLTTDCETKTISFIDFYKQMCSVEMNNDSDYIFRDKPNAKTLTPLVLDANTPLKKSSLRLKPLLIKGEWMQVEIEFTNDHKPIKPQRLWIKWRDDKKPLITYNIMCC